MKTIYYNGEVYTGELPLAEAFAVEDGRFLFAGSNEEAVKLAATGDELVDLRGNFVCSGFNDSHMHLLGFGNTLSCAPLASHTGSLEEMLRCLREFLENPPPRENGWILGRGWHPD